VSVVFCYDSSNDAKMYELQKEYDGAIKMNGYDKALVSFKGLEKTGGVPVHQALASYCDEEQPDFTVVAPDVNLARPELSVSEHMIKAVKSNVIVLKIPKDLQ